jgi:hypothetical protein
LDTYNFKVCVDTDDINNGGTYNLSILSYFNANVALSNALDFTITIDNLCLDSTINYDPNNMNPY